MDLSLFSSANTDPNPVSEITDLRIYPIKSCRGVSVPSATLTTQGLQYDRRWMFVDESNKFVTIRQKSQMTLINTAIDHSTSELTITMGKDSSKTVRVPLDPSESWLEENCELARVDIWDTNTNAWVYTDPKMGTLFSEFFGGPNIRLCMKGPEERTCKGNAAESLLGRKATVNFPDVMPVLVASEASLKELNSRLKEGCNREITIERFRPNIIIEGNTPWIEDSWKKIRINGDDSSLAFLTGGNREALDLDVQARCGRCRVPNVDPDTAEQDKHQPWDMLMKYRRIDEGLKYKPCFGMLCCPRNEGKVGVGMRFEVLATTADHKYVMSLKPS